MSTIAEDTKRAVTAAGRSTSPTRVRQGIDTVDAAPIRHVVDDRSSRATALLFQAVLFCAMCLSLLAVIQQAQSDPAPGSSGTGVDDAPPAVFVNAD